MKGRCVFMLKSKDIKKILENIPAGTTLTISQIQDVVRNSYQLSQDDMKPHTQSRPTTYERWRHRIQGVLSDYKRKGIVEHNKLTKSYTF